MYRPNSGCVLGVAKQKPSVPIRHPSTSDRPSPQSYPIDFSFFCSFASMMIFIITKALTCHKWIFEQKRPKISQIFRSKWKKQGFSMLTASVRRLIVSNDFANNQKLNVNFVYVLKRSAGWSAIRRLLANVDQFIVDPKAPGKNPTYCSGTSFR